MSLSHAPIRVLYATSECAPWSKTGGLADVAAALPAALRAMGVDIRVLTPAYQTLSAHATGILAELNATAHYPSARVLSATLPDGVDALLIDCPELYVRAGGVYQDETGRDWDDNARRYGQLSRVAVELATRTSGPWQPHLVHCNDWQTGLVAPYLHYRPTSRVPSVFTIHNLAFQGLFPAHVIPALGLPAESFSSDGLEFFGHCSFLKGGLAYSHALTTVSPTYAAEIQRPEFGMGMHGLLSKRSRELTGILNGIDATVWNPADDPYIVRRYDSDDIEGKSENKRALRTRLGLPDAGLPLLAMVSRLTEQKGVDLLLEVAPEITRLPAQLVVLGSGDKRFESALQDLARTFPAEISVTIGFDEGLAHLIEAGADIFLMPSRYEPCGMNQMYSQRYGTIPIVRATGGLLDSVHDFSPASGEGTGFLFKDTTADALLGAIKRSLEVYATPSWRKLQLNAMNRDFSWGQAAARYLEIYERLVEPVARRS